MLFAVLTQVLASLCCIDAQHGPFELRFRWLVATDTSAIAKSGIGGDPDLFALKP
jgi:hypothetical protein